MSIERSFNIRCDRCENSQGDLRNAAEETPSEVRKSLKAVGWIRIGREDFCEKCAPVELDERQ